MTNHRAHRGDSGHRGAHAEDRPPGGTQTHAAQRLRAGADAPRPRRAQALLAAAAVLTLTGCERFMRDMYAQPRLGPDAASPLFADGRGTRPPPDGSVPAAMGDLAKTSGGRRGRAELAARQAAAAAPDLAHAQPRLTLTWLERGRARFDIDCAPCHSALGDGDGQVARRGFPHPPSFHEARLRATADRHFYDVMSAGYGVMHSYADRLTPEDRWAVVAWIRALQLSRAAPVAELPAPVLAALQRLPERRADAGTAPGRSQPTAPSSAPVAASTPMPALDDGAGVAPAATASSVPPGLRKAPAGSG
jgi:mono/diheme cytochrome c family protein